MSAPNEHVNKLPKRANRLALPRGQLSIQNFFCKTNLNHNNITININHHEHHHHADAPPVANDTEGEGGADRGAADDAPGEPDQAGDGPSFPRPATRLPPAAARVVRPATRPARIAPNGITLDKGKFKYEPALKKMVKMVIERRFPAAVHGRWSSAAEFLATDNYYKYYFGERYVAVGVWYGGILDRDVRRFYEQMLAAEARAANGGAATPGGPRGRPPAINSELRALIKTRILEAFAEPVDGEVRMAVDYMAVECAVVTALIDAHNQSIPNLPPVTWRPSRSTVYTMVNEANLSWRKATSGTTLPDDWLELKLDMASRVAVVASTFNIPRERIYNADQAGVCVVPNNGNARTLAFRGEKRAIKIFGSGEKRQFTIMQLVNAAGDVGPPQMIVEGKGKRVVNSITEEQRKPLVDIGGTITSSPNHWSNNDTMREWLDDLFVPYLKKQESARRAREGGGSAPTNADMPHHIILLDCWYGHTDLDFRAYIRRRYPWLHLLFVPANCTSKLQPCDVAVQRPFKAGVAASFRQSIRRTYEEGMQQPGAAPKAVIKSMLAIPFLRGLAPSWVAAGVEAAQQHRDAISRVWDDVLPHLNDPQFILTAHQRVNERRLLNIRPTLPPEEEPSVQEDDVRPVHDHKALAEALASAVAEADAPMKRRRRHKGQDAATAASEDTDTVSNGGEEDEDDGAVVLDDDDDADVFSDDEVGMQRFVQAAADGLDDDADMAKTRELLAAAAREDADETTRQRSRRTAAALCEGRWSRLKAQGRL